MKNDLKKLSASNSEMSAKSIIKLLIADHKLIRKLMKRVKSKKANPPEKVLAFKELVKVAKSHVKAEEKNFLFLIKDNSKFEDNVSEGYEEHRVHENILSSINKLKDKDRKIEQMKIFCEILEHHLDEEEDELFPKFKKYASLSTHKKMGHKFLNTRRKTDISLKSQNKGSLRYGSKK